MFFNVKVGGMSGKLDLTLKFTLKVIVDGEDARVLGLVAGFAI
ncbi:hypothetical protein GCM10008018_28530 [Paenibacillus marchantiophytorum]|uniref:Uncharacterized protein n=1 Tax=Paenibacillus marchantiophytorum TaxID=1619310 RepID=A0ABQ1EPE5_9BACL|nr:hypothetical protein [Paenibacillus marchantiophytorum]GFZ81206.1 hypothetical protein GCM10008018_28530 [Paenibacillus marchantiophytorum]